MKKSIVAFIGGMLCVASSLPAWAGTSERIALIYRGPGSCGGSDNCSGAAAKVAERLGMTVRFVTPRTLTEEVFENAVLWIQPGGNAIDVAEALGKRKIALIRNFVSQGGGYVGFCAGMFFADTEIDDHGKVSGLGIIPVVTADYKGDRGDDGTILEINWRGFHRDVFFNGGGFIKVSPSALRLSVEVLAHYSTGEVAAIRTSFGNGRVAVSGFHPEATDSWKHFAVGRDNDGSDLDIAEDMARWALREDAPKRFR